MAETYSMSIKIPPNSPKKTVRDLISSLNKTGVSYRPCKHSGNGDGDELELRIQYGQNIDETFFQDQRVQPFLDLLNEKKLSVVYK